MQCTSPTSSSSARRQGRRDPPARWPAACQAPTTTPWWSAHPSIWTRSSCKWCRSTAGRSSSCSTTRISVRMPISQVGNGISWKCSEYYFFFRAWWDDDVGDWFLLKVKESEVLSLELALIKSQIRVSACSNRHDTRIHMYFYSSLFQWHISMLSHFAPLLPPTVSLPFLFPVD